MLKILIIIIDMKCNYIRNFKEPMSVLETVTKSEPN